MRNRAVFLTLQLFILVSEYLCDGIQSLSSRDLCPSAIPDYNAVVTINSSCLEFVNVEQTWHNAQLECQRKGGNLIQIQNKEFQIFIMATLKNMKWNRNGLWIGAHDIGREGHWEWINGETLTWSNWAEGQPSCYFPQLQIFCAEDCAILRYDSGGKWHDKRCNAETFQYSYICQYDISRTTPVNGFSPEVNSSIMPSPYVTPELSNTDDLTDYTTDSTDEYETNSRPTTVSGTTFQQKQTVNEVDNSTENSRNSTNQDGKWTTETVTHLSESKKSSPVSIDDKTSPERKGSNSSTELDFVEVETKASLWETTHIVIADDNYNTTDYSYDDYNNLPSKKAAHTKSTESKSIALTGPLLGSFLGLCLVCIVVVISFYYYKKRCRGGNDSWSVGFDNPNYGSQEGSDCRAERKIESGEFHAE